MGKILDKKHLDIELIVVGGFTSCTVFSSQNTIKDVDVITRNLHRPEGNVLKKAILKVACKQKLLIIEESKERNLAIFERPGLCFIAGSMRHALVNKITRLTEKDVGNLVMPSCSLSSFKMNVGLCQPSKSLRHI